MAYFGLGVTVKKATTRVALIAILALSMLVAVQAPALARWRAMADATLQVKQACVGGVRVDVGALSPRFLDENPQTSPLSATEDVLIRARIGDPATGQLVLDKRVTLPLHPRKIKMDDGRTALIDYFKRFTLRWNQRLEVGQTVSLKAVDAAFFEEEASQGGDAFAPPFEITTTVKNCRRFK